MTVIEALINRWRSADTSAAAGDESAFVFQEVVHMSSLIETDASKITRDVSKRLTTTTLAVRILP